MNTERPNANDDAAPSDHTLPIAAALCDVATTDDPAASEAADSRALDPHGHATRIRSISHTSVWAVATPGTGPNPDTETQTLLFISEDFARLLEQVTNARTAWDADEAHTDMR